MKVHMAIVKVGIDPADEPVNDQTKATVVVRCAECGEHTLTLPAVHLATLANACAAAAQTLGATALTEQLGVRQDNVDSWLAAQRKSAPWN